LQPLLVLLVRQRLLQLLTHAVQLLAHQLGVVGGVPSW
jgi:hypothetical protein